MSYKITVIPGDGIGKEITDSAVEVLKKVDEKFGLGLSYTYKDAGGTAYDKFGTPLPEDTIEACKASDGVLFGAVGGDKWDNVDPALRPEKAILGLRKNLGLYANLRPVKVADALVEYSPLKPELVKGVDLVIVRELIGGIYFGEHKTDDADGQPVATDIMKYSEAEIERIGRIGFETARKRNHRLCSVEKSNVLDTSRLWKKVMHRLAEEYTDVELTDMLVDNCAMQIVKNPAQFDVIVTENMFGDILSDEASMITGSIGMIPSSSLGATSCGLYEPIHGSAPDIAGQDLANPIGTILSAAMMLRYSFDMAKEADAVEHAVSKYLDAGYRTADIMEDGMTKVGCKKCGDLILEYLTKE